MSIQESVKDRMIHGTKEKAENKEEEVIQKNGKEENTERSDNKS